MSILKSTIIALTLTVIAVPAFAEESEGWRGKQGGYEHGRQMRRGGNPAEKFKKLDTNGDGKLSQEELEAGRKGKGKFEEKFEERFNKRDLNGDGSITKEEARTAHKNKKAEMFKKLDKDGDGYVSKEEMKEMRKHRKGGMRKHMRRNRDGGDEE